MEYSKSCHCKFHSVLVEILNFILVILCKYKLIIFFFFMLFHKLESIISINFQFQFHFYFHTYALDSTFHYSLGLFVIYFHVHKTNVYLGSRGSLQRHSGIEETSRSAGRSVIYIYNIKAICCRNCENLISIYLIDYL